jgi:predicted DsbA family dithiol-disulfide isomerase
MVESSASVEVEIYSDVVCPWCYIGKRRWERALDQLVNQHGPAVLDRINVVFKPYQLDPSAPAVPVPVREGYAKKFGGEAKADQIIAHVTQTAAGEGLGFRMDRALRANTRHAHRLLEFAVHHGLQPQIKERLLSAYFVEGLDVGNIDTLANLASEVGLDHNEVAVFLQSGDGVRELVDELNAGVERGVSAVPTFVFNGEFAVPGAQDPEVFVRVLTKLLDAQ